MGYRHRSYSFGSVSAMLAGLLTLATPLAHADTSRVGRSLQVDHTPLSVEALAAMLPAPAGAPALEQAVPNVLPLAPAVRDEPSPPDVLLEMGEGLARSPTAGASFEGPSSDDNQQVLGARSQPPDTNGDVSENFVVSYINRVWSVYDKQGNRLAGPLPGNSVWAGFGGPCETDNAGDAVGFYDAEARRWVFTQFAPTSGIECFAISDTEDPRAGFTRYAFLLEPFAFNDYPKVGVWLSADGEQNAYTYTGRNFTPQSEPQFPKDITAVLFDREAMLQGLPATYTQQAIPGAYDLFDGPQPGTVQAGSLAPAGACPLFSVAAGRSDQYFFFEYCENFPAAGDFRELGAIPVPPFDDTLGPVPQPNGGDFLDTTEVFTRYRANHAVIDGEHRLALAHSVDVGGDRGGMRWAILNVDDYDAITLIDTGTHAPDDGLERWMGSVALDREGNLGLGYSRGGGGELTAAYFTGRETTDPAGTVQQEVECVQSTGVQTGGIGRWGDYSATVLDPDGCTFWTFQEYVVTTGSFQWNTRVCSFSFPSCVGEAPTDFVLLTPDPGIAGQVNTFTSQNGTAGGFVAYYLGVSAGSTSVTLGTCTTALQIANARLLGAARDADGDGAAALTRGIPLGAQGLTLRFQAIDLVACVASDVVVAGF